MGGLGDRGASRLEGIRGMVGSSGVCKSDLWDQGFRQCLWENGGGQAGSTRGIEAVSAGDYWDLEGSGGIRGTCGVCRGLEGSTRGYFWPPSELTPLSLLPSPHSYLLAQLCS